MLVDLDAWPDAAIALDATGVVTAANEPAGRLFGVARASLVGRRMGDLGLCDDQGQPWPGTDSRVPVDGETVVGLGSGSRYAAAARPLVDPSANGDPRGVGALVRFRPASGGGLDATHDATLISTVAHELRSPLTGVKGFTATLLRRWDQLDDDRKRVMLQAINSDADRVVRLIVDLLDVSRIDTGRLQLRRQLVDVPALVARHIDRLEAGGYPRDRFRVQVAGGLAETWLDPDRVDQVVSNLLDNAVRHGDGVVSVHLATVDGVGGPRLIGEIADEGQGIAPENYDQVFTRFWHQSGRGGTGLGLYLVRGLVEAHGGTITVGRAPSGGALFRFEIPAGAPDYVA